MVPCFCVTSPKLRIVFRGLRSRTPRAGESLVAVGTGEWSSRVAVILTSRRGWEPLSGILPRVALHSRRTRVAGCVCAARFIILLLQRVVGQNLVRRLNDLKFGVDFSFPARVAIGMVLQS